MISTPDFFSYYQAWLGVFSLKKKSINHGNPGKRFHQTKKKKKLWFGSPENMMPCRNFRNSSWVTDSNPGFKVLIPSRPCTGYTWHAKYGRFSTALVKWRFVVYWERMGRKKGASNLGYRTLLGFDNYKRLFDLHHFGSGKPLQNSTFDHVVDSFWITQKVPKTSHQEFFWRCKVG